MNILDYASFKRAGAHIGSLIRERLRATSARVLEIDREIADIQAAMSRYGRVKAKSRKATRLDREEIDRQT